MPGLDQPVALRLCAHASWIPLVQAVVGQGAAVFGLGRDKALRLTMAAEELVAHLAGTTPGAPINLALEPGGWCVRADFSFTADPSDLWAMNLAARAEVGAGEGMDHLGLLLASRMVDSFGVRLDGKTVHLALRQDRHYPSIEAQPRQRAVASGAVSIAANPEPALVSEACALVAGLYPAHLVPQPFTRPGKAVDMIARGDLDVAVAVDETGALAGAICWWMPSEQSVSFCGPYVFVEGGDVAEVLETHLLQAVARTRAIGLFSDLASGELNARNFEPLGQLQCTRGGLRVTTQGVWYRHLREDLGAVVWAHPGMFDFLEKGYERLVLIRQLREAQVKGETLPERSVFSARLRPELSEASLAPMVVGRDVAEAVARHVELLHQEGYRNIFFRLDLAHGWQAAMGGALLDRGFAPRLILPYAGKSDVVVFQHV